VPPTGSFLPCCVFWSLEILRRFDFWRSEETSAGRSWYMISFCKTREGGWGCPAPQLHKHGWQCNLRNEPHLLTELSVNHFLEVETCRATVISHWKGHPKAVWSFDQSEDPAQGQNIERMYPSASKLFSLVSSLQQFAYAILSFPCTDNFQFIPLASAIRWL
jgi:hypothetical protein